MPVLVLIPAPVNTIQCLLSLIHCARVSSLNDRSASLSKYSCFSSSSLMFGADGRGFGFGKTGLESGFGLAGKELFYFSDISARA